MPYCTNCGYKYAVDDEECPSCGKALPRTAAATATATAAATAPAPAAAPMTATVAAAPATTFTSTPSPVTEGRGSFAAPAAATWSAGDAGTYAAAPAYTPSYAASASAAASDPAAKGSWGWWVLGLFFPLIGFILFLVWMNNRKADAKKAGWGALFGTLVSIALTAAVLGFAVIFAGTDGGYIDDGGYGGNVVPVTDDTSAITFVDIQGPTTLVDNEYLTYVLTPVVGEANANGIYFTATVTNKTKRAMVVCWSNPVINAYAVQDYPYLEVAAGQTVTDDIWFEADEVILLEGNVPVGKLGFLLEAYDADTYDTLVEQDFVGYVNGYTAQTFVAQPRRTVDGEKVIISTDAMYMVVYGFRVDNYGYLVMDVYFQNRSGSGFTYFWDEYTFNGVEVLGIEGATLYPGDAAYLQLSIDQDDLNGKTIDDLQAFGFTITGYQVGTYESFEETYTVTR